MAAAQPDAAAEIEKLQEKLDEVDTKIAEGEAKHEEAFKKFEDEYSKELKQKLDSYGHGLKYNIDMTFSNLDSRMGDYATSDIKSKQTDVLRLNKIIRDVSKALVKDWKNVFVHLMTGPDIPMEEVNNLVKKIQKNKPTVQSIKAMTIWKESLTEVHINKLTEALRAYDKNELADHVDAISLCEAEELLKIGDVPAAAISKLPEGAEAQPEYVELLPNSKLLVLSKKIGPAWLDLANMLGMPESDMDDIKESEGLTYQGAFRILFAWRDMTSEKDINQVEVLIEALNACNMQDVAELVK